MYSKCQKELIYTNSSTKNVSKIDVHVHVTPFPHFAPALGGGDPMLSAQQQLAVWDELNVEKGVLLPLVSSEGLYCDLSAMSGANALMRDPEYAARFIEEFSDRMLYGGDLCSPTQKFPFAFDAFLDALVDDGMISSENYYKLVRGNAERLLDL